MAKFTLRARVAAIVLTVPLIASACSGNHYAPNSPTSGVGPMSAADDLQPDGANVSVLKHLKTQTVIGSTIDPKFKQLNPYGLAVAPSTMGAFTAGDLVVCNFNARSNVQEPATRSSAFIRLRARSLCWSPPVRKPCWVAMRWR